MHPCMHIYTFGNCNWRFNLTMVSINCWWSLARLYHIKWCSDPFPWWFLCCNFHIHQTDSLLALMFSFCLLSIVKSYSTNSWKPYVNLRTTMYCLQILRDVLKLQLLKSWWNNLQSFVVNQLATSCIMFACPKTSILSAFSDTEECT